MRFGSLAHALAATRAAQSRVVAEPRAVDHLQAIRMAMRHSLRANALDRPLVATSEALLDYLRLELVAERAEQFRVLFLDVNNALLLDLVLSRGSPTEVPIYPREVVRHALEVGATAVILVHNHPSGDPTPSEQDVRITHLIQAAAALFELHVHDHVVIAGDGWSSLAALGLLRDQPMAA